MNLAFDNHRVDARAAVIQGIEAPDLAHTRIAVDVDDAQIGTEGKGEIRRVIVFHHLQPHFHPVRDIVVGRPGDLLHGLFLPGHTLHLETVDIPIQIIRADFEQVGGDLARLVPQLARRLGGGSTPHRGTARAVGAQPIGYSTGIALLDLDILRRDTELSGDDLGIGRLMPLTLADGPDAGDGAARGVDTDLATLEHADTEYIAGLARTGADDFGEGTQANAHQLATSAFLRLFLAQALVVGRLEHLVQRGGIIPAVIFPAER